MKPPKAALDIGFAQGAIPGAVAIGAKQIGAVTSPNPAQSMSFSKLPQ